MPTQRADAVTSELAALLVQAGSGDRAAFDAFALAARPLVERIARRFAGGSRCALQLDELCADVLVDAWRFAGSYRPDRGRVATWLGLLVRSRGVDRLRAQSRRAGRASAAVDTATPCSRPAVDEHAALRDAVSVGLNRLAAEEREVLDCAVHGGLSHSQAAERLGLPLGTVKSRVRRAQRRLRTILADWDPDARLATAVA